MAVGVEIERKFRLLAHTELWSEQGFTVLAAWEIWQGYVTPADADPEVRVRRLREVDMTTVDAFEPQALLGSDGEPTVVRWLAVKSRIPTSDAGALSRQEIETPIDEDFFTEAWRFCDQRRLHKIRIEYMVQLPVDGHRVIVVDHFRDHLEGLSLAEIEFGDWTASTRFDPPGFLGREVTHDERYRNARLAEADKPPPEPA